jgi:DNA repair protein RadC
MTASTASRLARRLYKPEREVRVNALQAYVVSGGEDTADRELLAMVLDGVGCPGEAAGALLTRFGSLHALANAEVFELAQTEGVSVPVAIRLHAVLQLGRRSVRRATDLRALRSVDDAYALFAPRFEGRRTEELHAAFIDRCGYPLAVRRLTVGSEQYTVVDPRQIFRIAVSLGASGVILAHNHPSGDPTPSEQDRDVTRRAMHAGNVLGITLYDHLVIGRDCYVSIAREGGFDMVGGGRAWPV